MDTADPDRARRGRLWRWSGRLLTVAVLVATFVALRDRWAGVEQTSGWPHAGWVAAAVAVNIAGNLLLIDAWRCVVALTGPRLPLGVAADIWGSSQLTRLVVPAAPVAARATLAARHGIPRGIGALTTLIEFAWMLIGTPLLALATAPWWLSTDAGSLAWVAAFALLPALVLIAVVSRPRRTLQLLATSLARLPVVGPRLEGTAEAVRTAPLERRVTVAILARYVLTTTTRLAGFLLLAAGVVGMDGVGTHLPVLVGAFALGRFVGTIAIFAPGGIGPREGVTALVLGPRIGGGPVLVLVAFARLVEFAAELLLLAGARLRRGTRRGGGAAPPPESAGTAWGVALERTGRLLRNAGGGSTPGVLLDVQEPAFDRAAAPQARALVLHDLADLDGAVSAVIATLPDAHVVERYLCRLCAFGDDPDAFLAAHLSAKRRKRLRSDERKLAATGPVRVTWAGPGDIATLWPRFHALLADRARQTRRWDAAVSGPSTRELWERTGGRDLRISVLWAGEQPVSFRTGYLVGERFVGHMPIVDRTIPQVSLGDVHMWRLLEQLRAAGVTTYLMGKGDNEHKATWGTGTYRMVTVVAPLRRSAAARLAVARELAREHLRRQITVRGLEHPLRRLLHLAALATDAGYRRALDDGKESA